MTAQKRRFLMWFCCLAMAAVLAGLPVQANAACGKPNGSKPATSRRLPSLSSKGSGLGNRNNSIVGLWHVTYLNPHGTEFFQSFEQWHSDGNEIEVADLGPGVLC